MKIITFLFLMASGLPLFAQSILISGKVVIDFPIEGQNSVNKIQVVNNNSYAKTSTSEDGLYSIRVVENDVLVFSSEWYIERSIKITKTMIEKGFLTIHLEPEVIELAEAKIHNLSKNLKDNIVIKDDPLDQVYRNMGIDPEKRFMKININQTSSLSGGMLGTIALITGQYKKDKRRFDYFKKVDELNGIISFYTKSYFTETLKIPEGKVYEFVDWVYHEKKLKPLAQKRAYEEMSILLEKYASEYLAKSEGSR